MYTIPILNAITKYHGRGIEALKLFWEMLQAGICPDSVTFIGVLSACSHAGLVGKGCKYFNLTSAKYGVIPGVEHFGCMVDLLGRAWLLD